MQTIYNYMPETNLVSKVHNVLTILWLQYMVRVMLFSLIKRRTFTLARCVCMQAVPNVVSQFPRVLLLLLLYRYHYLLKRNLSVLLQ